LELLQDGGIVGAHLPLRAVRVDLEDLRGREARDQRLGLRRRHLAQRRAVRVAAEYARRRRRRGHAAVRGGRVRHDDARDAEGEGLGGEAGAELDERRRRQRRRRAPSPARRLRGPVGRGPAQRARARGGRAGARRARERRVGAERAERAERDEQMEQQRQERHRQLRP
jgi:hypothetical protein